jgi:hypothetical protein
VAQKTGLDGSATAAPVSITRGRSNGGIHRAGADDQYFCRHNCAPFRFSEKVNEFDLD